MTDEILKKLKITITTSYHDLSSPAFGKSAQIVRQIALQNVNKKYTHLLTPKLVRETLEHSIAYSNTHHLNRNKVFHGTGLYSPHPHH